MLLQSHLLSTVSGENDAVNQKIWLVGADTAELHKTENCNVYCEAARETML